MNLWRRHPGVRTGTESTTGERTADYVRNGMGSWPFVFVFLATMAVWAVYNRSGEIQDQRHFDWGRWVASQRGLE